MDEESTSFMGWSINPLILTIGVVYLSYERYEKAQELLSRNKERDEKAENERIIKAKNLVKIEKEKIKSAIRMDFVLSVEVVLIALNTVKNNPLTEQILIVSFVSRNNYSTWCGVNILKWAVSKK